MKFIEKLRHRISQKLDGNASRDRKMVTQESSPQLSAADQDLLTNFPKHLAEGIIQALPLELRAKVRLEVAKTVVAAKIGEDKTKALQCLYDSALQTWLTTPHSYSHAKAYILKARYEEIARNLGASEQEIIQSSQDASITGMMLRQNI
jgi:hypothetical protein